MFNSQMSLRDFRKFAPSPTVSDKPPREAIAINLSPAAKVIVESLREDTGVPKVEAISRLLEWFAGMPRKFRLAILSKDVAGRDELLIDWFREQMSTKGLDIEPLPSGDVGARVRLINRMLNEIHATYAGTKEVAEGMVIKKKKG